MKYEIKFTTRFKQDYKRIKKRGFDLTQLHELIESLAQGHELDSHFHDHPLIGNYHGARECHVQPDWLLIYKIHQKTLVLDMLRTGSHADLF